MLPQPAQPVAPTLVPSKTTCHLVTANTPTNVYTVPMNSDGTTCPSPDGNVYAPDMVSTCSSGYTLSLDDSSDKPICKATVRVVSETPSGQAASTPTPAVAPAPIKTKAKCDSDLKAAETTSCKKLSATKDKKTHKSPQDVCVSKAKLEHTSCLKKAAKN